jgi:4-amino-4-deoxy-L-arabinose transferase-like glycosyltransferase
VRYYYEVREEVPLSDGSTVEIVTGPGTTEPYALHPPALITFLGAESWLGLRSVRAHQFALAVIGTASIVLTGLLGRRLCGDRTGLIAAGIFTVYANIWINDGLVMTETVSIFAVMVMTLLALRFWKSPSTPNAAWFGLACGIGMLTRIEVALYLPIIAVAWLVRTKVRWRDRIVPIAIATIVAGLVVTPWVTFNISRFRDPVTLSSGSGITLSQSNCDLTYGGQFLGSWRGECSGPFLYGPNGTRLDESETSTALTRRAREYIDANQTRLLTVVVPARIGRLWGVFRPFQTVRIEIDEWRPAFVSWLGFVQYLLLVPFALAGAVILWRRRGPWIVLIAWPLIVTLTAATAFGNIRYRSTAEPVIVILAALTIDALLDRRTSRNLTRRPGTDGVQRVEITNVPPA